MSLTVKATCVLEEIGSVSEFTPERNKEVTRKLGGWCSKGVGSLGVLFLAHIVVALWEKFGLPVVSVGSGQGVLEYVVRLVNPRIEVICVDPNPLNFSETQEYLCDETIWSPPQYGCVDDLLKVRPDLVSKCVMLSIWALYSSSEYDYDAFISLQPVAAMFVDQPGGGAGGDSMRMYITCQDSHRAMEYYATYPCIESFGGEVRNRCCVLYPIGEEFALPPSLVAHFSEVGGDATTISCYVAPEFMDLLRAVTMVGSRFKGLKAVFEKYV